jgi:hypothetical protein
MYERHLPAFVTFESGGLFQPTIANLYAEALPPLFVKFQLPALRISLLNTTDSTVFESFAGLL